MATSTQKQVIEMKAMTKENRERLEKAFLPSRDQQAQRCKVLFPYHQHTVDQIVIEMYASAERTSDDLHIDSATRSTMARHLAVVKAWVTLKADDLVEADDVDYCLTALVQIAGYSPGEMVAALLPEREWEDRARQWGTVHVEARPKAKPPVAEADVEIRWGSGEKAIAAIIGEYLDQRLEDPAAALEWLGDYRNAVRQTANQFRVDRAAHNKAAAGGRKGSGDGTSKKAKGAKNAGGTGGKAAKEAEAAKERAAAKATKAAKRKPKTAAECPLGEATVGQLIAFLGKAVADTGSAIEVAEDRAFRDLETMWDKREKRIPLGMTAADVKGKGRKARVRKPVGFAGVGATVSKLPSLDKVTEEAARQNAVNKGQVPWGTSAQVNRALQVMEREGYMTAKKRKEIMLGVMDGSVNEARFRTLVAKAEAKRYGQGALKPTLELVTA